MAAHPQPLLANTSSCPPILAIWHLVSSSHFPFLGVCWSATCHAYNSGEIGAAVATVTVTATAGKSCQADVGTSIMTAFTHQLQLGQQPRIKWRTFAQGLRPGLGSPELISRCKKVIRANICG